MKVIFIIALITLAASSLYEAKPACYHDKLKNEFINTPSSAPTFKYTQFEKFHRIRTLQERPLKIIFHYQPTDFVHIGLVKDSLEIASNFLSKRLTVLYSEGNFVPTKTSCGDQAYSSTHASTGFSEDLLLLVTMKNDPNSGLAAAVHCEFHPITGRPITGRIEYQTSKISDDPRKFGELIDTSIHEIVHVLGFNNDLFPNYISGFRNPAPLGLDKVSKPVVFKGVSGRGLITKKVVEVAQKHYNCPSIDFAPLENEGDEGSRGSHWERLAFHHEMLCASDTILDTSFSEFTMALLEDSGWYRVKYDLAEPLFFGKAAGCDFFNDVCSPQKYPDIFCPEQKQTCALANRGKAGCSKDNFSNSCLITIEQESQSCEFAQNTPNPNHNGEVFGLGSRCVLGSVVSVDLQNPSEPIPLCYKVRCNSQTAEVILSDGSQVVCRRKGERVALSNSSKFSGEIVCPDVNHLCNLPNVACENNCSRRGYCISGKCECNAGFTGHNCSNRA